MIRQKQKENIQKAFTEAKKRKASAEANREREAERLKEQERREVERLEAEKRRLRDAALQRRTEEDERAREKDVSEAEKQIRMQARVLEVEARERERVAREEIQRKADAEARLQKENDVEQQRWEEVHLAGKQRQESQQLLESKMKIAAKTESHRAQSEQARSSKQHEEKQRQADERSRRVAEQAQERHAAAAADRLRRQADQERNAADRQEDQNSQRAPRVPMHTFVETLARETPTPSSSSFNVEERSRGLKMKMAREWAHSKYREALTNAGGPAHEEELFEVRIELGWDKVISEGQCLVCKTNIKSKYMFRCPDGGATACPGCKAKYATFRGV
jgi:hypothetical protein